MLVPPEACPQWASEFPPFQAWTRNGGQADEETMRCFTRIAGRWPYIRAALRARDAGIPNTRVLVLETGLGETALRWQRYLSELHLPGIAALAGETLYQVRASDCRAAGIRVRDYDANIFGAAGVMLTGYQDGDVAWRAFLADGAEPGLDRQERGYVTAMRDFAAGEAKSRARSGWPAGDSGGAGWP